MKSYALFLAAFAAATPAMAANDPYSVVENINGVSILAQFDSSTGRLVAGSNQALDGNSSGPDAPIDADRILGFDFAPDGSLWAMTRNISGNTIFASFDINTGRLIAGSNQGLDGNVSGPDAPIQADRVSGITFAPNGSMYSVVRNTQGIAVLASFDLSTGRLVSGTNQFLDGNANGPDAPIDFDRILAYDFAPNGDFFALTRNISGITILAKFDINTGRLISGSNQLLNGNSNGPDAPIAGDRIGGLAFDPDGGMWSVVRNNQGFSTLAQFDPLTGRLIAGTNQFLDGNASGPDAPIAFDRIRGLTFAPNLGGGAAPVPEPATWAMLLVGFGAVGGAIRRRQVKIAYA
jgi:hypothetical protein